MYKQGVGFMVLMMGCMTADSNSLIVPTALLAIGAWLVWKGAKADV